MKHKRNLALVLLAGTVIAVQPVSADEPEENPAETLDPFEYKELEFRKKTEYLHDRGQVEMKNTISEAQINLDFSEEVRIPSPIEVSELFLEPGRSETGTAAAKAAELGLFTEEAPVSEEAAAKEPQQAAEEQSEGTPVRNWIFIGVIVLAVAGLFAFVVPALLKGGGGGAQPERRRKETEGNIA